jgi:hypothetical protein
MSLYHQNRDLVILSFFGFIYYAVVVGLSGHLTKVPMGEYFIVPFLVSILMGISISRTSQMIEWPLCFLFGGALGSINIIAVLSLLGMSFSFYDVAFTLSNTFAWFGVVSVMILIGILLGAFLKATYNLVLGSLNMSFD